MARLTVIELPMFVALGVGAGEIDNLENFRTSVEVFGRTILGRFGAILDRI